MLSLFPVLGTMPFWGPSGFMHCVEDGVTIYDDIAVSRMRLRVNFELDVSILDDFSVRHPFIKGGRLYFCGCRTDSSPTLYNYKVVNGKIKNMGLKVGPLTVATNQVSYRGRIRTFGGNVQIIRVVPCYEQSMKHRRPFLITLFDASSVSIRSVVYNADDGSVLSLVSGESGKEVSYPTIYNGVMAHVAVRDGSQVIVLDTPKVR